MPVSTFYFRYSEQTVCHYESSRDPVFVLSASLRYRFIRSLTPPKRSSTHTASRGQQSLRTSHICVFITSLTYNLLYFFLWSVTFSVFKNVFINLPAVFQLSSVFYCFGCRGYVHMPIVLEATYKYVDCTVCALSNCLFSYCYALHFAFFMSFIWPFIHSMIHIVSLRPASCTLTLSASLGRAPLLCLIFRQAIPPWGFSYIKPPHNNKLAKQGIVWVRW